MFKFNLFLALVIAVNGAPRPYYSRSLVETPTSRVEQHLLLSPQMHQSYRVQPQHVMSFSDFDFPKEQVVYYYPQHAQNAHQPLNLYELRQDMPWWQDLWNQLVGQGGLEEGEEGASSEDLFGESGEAQKATEMATTTVATNYESQSANDEADEESNKIAPNDDSESIEINSNAESVEINSNFESTRTHLDPTPDIIEMNSKFESTKMQSAPTPEELGIRPATNVEVIQGTQQMHAPLHQVFSHNQKYYIASGLPEFYGQFDAFKNPTAPIFSLQQLQPIVRSEDNNSEKVQKIAPLPLPSTEPTSTLRINVVDENVETEKNAKDYDEAMDVSARSKLLEDNQNLEEEEKMSSEEEKREESTAEGESK